MQASYGSAPTQAAVARKSTGIAFVFAIIAAALVAAVGIISYAKYTSALGPVSTMQMTKLGSEYQVASALMKHAVDKEFEENAPVPENIADLAKAAEEEMKIDAEVT